MQAWMLMLSVMLADPADHPSREPCVHAQERATPVESLPAAYHMQLVGVGFDQRMKPTVVIRHGDPNKGSSTVHHLGETLWGRVTFLAVGAQSALLRADGKLYTLRLKNRVINRDWNATVQALPLCEKEPGTASGR